jgi:hypothetical protein
MTAIIGIKCKNGVVIGADSCVTFANAQQVPTIERQMDKIEIISNNIIIAGTGEVGLGQRFCDIVQTTMNPNAAFNLDQPALNIVRFWSANALEDRYNTVGKFSAISSYQGYGALVAFPAKDQPCLCEFQVKDFQPELKTKLFYSSMGCAQHITDAFLSFLMDIFWKNDIPNVQGGIFAAEWTLQHVIDNNTGGVKEPTNIAVLEYDQTGKLAARILTKDDLDEVGQSITEAKKDFVDFPPN